MSKNKITQKDRLLRFLRSRGSSGVFVYEIMASRPNGLGIAQYGARILELRKQGYRIKNKKPGLFVLVEVNWDEMRRESIKERNGDGIASNQLSFI